MTEHVSSILSILIALLALLQTRSLWLQGQARRDRQDTKDELVQWLRSVETWIRALEERVGGQNGRVGKVEEWSRNHDVWSRDAHRHITRRLERLDDSANRRCRIIDDTDDV